MENKIIVVYKSSTGFTKEYAEMIAEKINSPVVDYKNMSAKSLSKYDVIIFGSRAHAGRIDGYKNAKDLFQKSGANNIVLFVTGATPNDEEETLKTFWKQNLSADEIVNIPHFYMQSGLRYERMGFADRLMMKAAAFIMKKKKDKDAYEKEFERRIMSSYDISSEEYIDPLVSFVRENYK